MIWKFVLSALFTCLATVLIYTIKSNVKLQHEVATLNRDIFKLEERLKVSTEECQALTEEKAWKEGLEAGRKTDTLYRQIVKKYSGNKRFTVMINGVKEDEL